MDLSGIRNPIIDEMPAFADRDPEIVYHEGVFYIFHTRVDLRTDRSACSLVMHTSRDLVHWDGPRLLFDGPEMFSAPGNVVRHNGQWVLCFQSYPITPGRRYGNEHCRLFTARSDDLIHWSDPEVMIPAGTYNHFANSPRQIDPFLVEHDGAWWCFYKTAGAIGLLRSPDLVDWEELSLEAPILSAEMTPDKTGMENPYVIRHNDEWWMFFSAVRRDRGMGIARSDDLLHWRDVEYIEITGMEWANNGPTASAIVDLREETGKWMMCFHGEYDGPLGLEGALALALSDDLIHWHCPR